MKLVTAKQMRELDRAAIEKHGVPSLELMERAGSAVADAAQDMARKRKGPVVVVCGSGNNGGDGLVAARVLHQRGIDVTAILLTRSSDLSPDARANWERLVPLTAHVFDNMHPDQFAMHHPTFAGASVIVDAILGTGLAREVAGPLAQAIEYLNALHGPIVAVDIPSGLSADTGKPLGVAIRAARTVTLGMPKLGLYVGDADDHVGDITVADIGIPAEEIEALATPLAMTDPALVRQLFAPREPASHKGTYGHVAVVAGSAGKLGAGYLASMAALRAGAGLVTYYLPERSFEKFDARYAEIMCHPLPDRGRGHLHPDGLKDLTDDLAKKNVIALGPALGTADDTRNFVNGLIDATALPLVVDADGLNVLDLARLKRRRAPTVLTPHPAEFGRLAGRSTDEVQGNRVPLAMKFAGENRVHLVLKGHNTVTATADGRLFINPTGNPAMASAGMGDALTGLIAGLIAQGIDSAMAAAAGAYLHGLAGDRAAEDVGDRGVVASDVIKRIPLAMRMTIEANG